VIATEVAREATQRHAATGNAAIAMGRAGAAGLLLATLTKGDERVTLQILGDGPLGAITVDATSEGAARVFLKHPEPTPVVTDDLGRPRLGSWVGRSGVVSVIRDLGMRDTFSGQTAIVNGEIDGDVEKYLMDSEQIDSVLACETLLDSAGHIRLAVGVLLQAMPGGDGAELLENVRARFRAGLLTSALLKVAAEENPGNLVEAISDATLGEYAIALNILDERPVRFHCPCSRERAASSIGLLGEADLATMIQEDGEAEVTCDFCRTQYQFSDVDLEEIRRALRKNTNPPS